MKRAKEFSEIIKNLSLLTQLGLSLITPLLLCLGLCWWLTSRFGIGGWVYIPGFFFGLGGSASVGLKAYQSVQRKQKKEKEKERPLSLNRHL